MFNWHEDVENSQKWLPTKTKIHLTFRLLFAYNRGVEIC